MIKIVSVYAASDGATFASEKEAREHELAALLKATKFDSIVVGESGYEASAAKFIITNAVDIIAILTAKPDAPASRKPRSDRGKNHAKRNQVMAVSLEETK